MQQVFEPKTHAHTLRGADALQDCSPTDVVGSTPREGVGVTLIGMAIDILLGIVKILAGMFSGSHALVADGVHSFSDAATDVMVIFMMRYSRQPADVDHPYGHDRFETLGTVIMGFLLLLVAVGLAAENLLNWMGAESGIQAGWLAVVIALVSIGVKEWLFRYTRKVGEKIQSELIVSNAWHSRTDAVSSGIVLIAILGAWAGMEWLDFVAAIAVAVAIGKIGWTMTLDNVKELVDTAIAPEKQQMMVALIEQPPQIDCVTSFKSRRMGKKYLIECVLHLPKNLTVAEGAHIASTLKSKLLLNFPEVKAVTFSLEASP
ncbi:MAG: cation transporter [Alteromonadaceae bacterium]|nr:cation transporter [Alteromonadaceae bacterium]